MIFPGTQKILQERALFEGLAAEHRGVALAVLGTQDAGYGQMPTAPRSSSQVRRVTHSACTERIRIISYNIGGMSTDSYDVCANWLQTQQLADVVILQEIHWGLGKEHSRFQIGSWNVATCVDSNNRFSGVAICISTKLSEADDLRFASVVPGRLMHVRCQRSDFCIDIVGVYQWA